MKDTPLSILKLYKQYFIAIFYIWNFVGFVDDEDRISLFISVHRKINVKIFFMYKNFKFYGRFKINFENIDC